MMDQMIDYSPKRLLKAREVAEILNISRAYAYQLISRGELRSVTIGTARRVRPVDLESFIRISLSPPISMEVE